MFCEECWFLHGVEIGSYYIGRLVYHSKGTAGMVEFDWSKAVESNLLGFYHSHGAGDPYLSNEDTTTMRAWIRSEGRPMLCGVFGNDKQQCWVFYRDDGTIKHCPIRTRIMGSFFVGKRIKMVSHRKDKK